jgi:hypothetical protein
LESVEFDIRARAKSFRDPNPVASNARVAESVAGASRGLRGMVNEALRPDPGPLKFGGRQAAMRPRRTTARGDAHRGPGRIRLRRS